MADQIDAAQDLAERERDAAISRRQQPAAGGAAEFCVDCGEPIPQARREAVPGAQRCAHCQSQLEGGSR